nr:MAG TPA: PSHCP spectroscopy, cyanobacteria, tRNA, Tudor [Caudoviricetes sp.]
MDIEYIPGDLVMVKESALRFAKDKTFKVISSLISGFVKVVMLNDSSTTYSISNNAVRPIPLTPEILEKNGWEHKYDIYFKEFPHRILAIMDENAYIINECCSMFLCPAKFVPQLQHLLFGLGLNSEMEL